LPFVLARGRCRSCGEGLPLRLLVLPPGATVLFTVSALVFSDLGVALVGGLFATVFLLLTVTDLERRLLPNRVVYPATLLAATLAWAWPEASVLEVLAGGLVGIGVAGALLVFSLPFGPGAFGLGDVKMIVLMGFVLGLPSFAVGLAIGVVSAAVVAAVLLLTGRVSRRDFLPHGPFLALGGIVGLFAGQDLWDAYRG
jgi:prepilin signal peptidase PulO-like enzyme (type II secretory pathway)